VLVAKAATLAADLEIDELSSELRAAFHRLLEQPVKRDPGCAAKTAIATALHRGSAYEDALFLLGVRYVQRDPVWGGTVDVACELRAMCAMALLNLHHPAAASEVAELLADPEPTARAGAARAIAYSEDARFAPLLRHKILVGDAEPQVLAECLAALLRIEGDGALELCGRVLDRADGSHVELVCVALGESRLPGALGTLRDFWDRTAAPDLRRTALLAIALLRDEAAHVFLLEVIASAPGHDARDAIAALAVFRDDETLRQRVLAAARTRDDGALRAAIAELERPRER
jgi:HEAT repeat protein